MNWLKRIFTPPTFDDPQKTLNARLLHPILLALFIFIIPDTLLVFIFSPENSVRFGLAALLTILFCLTLLGLERRGQVRLASILLVSGMWLLMAGLTVTGTGLYAPAFLSGYLVLIVIAGPLINGRASLLVAVTALLAALGLLVAENLGLWTPAPRLSPLAIWAVTALLFFTVAIVQYISSRNLQDALQQARAELAERHQVEQDLHQALRHEQRLNEVARTISGNLDLNTAVPTLVRLACELVGAEMGSLALLTSNGEGLVETYNYAMPAALLSADPIPRGSGLSWLPLETGEPVWVDDYPAHPRAMQFAVEAGVRAFLSAPVVVGERPLGVIKLFSTNPATRFTSRDVDLAASLGQQAGILIHNARLFEQTQQRARQLSILNQVGQTVASLRDLPGLLETIYQQTRQTLDTDVFFVGLYDAEAQLLTFPIMYDGGKRWEQKPYDMRYENLSKQAIDSGQPFLINRTPEEVAQGVPSYTMLGDLNRVSASLLYAPLRDGQQVIGVISVQSYTLNAYTSDDYNLFIGIANQVAVAIQNARLFAQAQQRARQLSILNQIGQTVASLRDLPGLLETIYQQTRQTLDTDVFFVGLYDAARNLLSFPVLYDGGQRWEQVPFDMKGDSLAKQVLLNGQPLLINRTPEMITGVQSSTLVGDREKVSASLLFAPLRDGQQVTGVISVQSYTLNAYTDDDLNLFIGIANQIAVAIQNTRLYEATQRQLEELRLLHTIAIIAMQAASQEQLLERAVEQIGQSVFLDLLSFWLLDEKTGELRRAATFEHEHIHSLHLQKIPLHSGVIGTVAARGQPMRVPDVSQEPAYVVGDPEIRSELCVPMRVGERVIGAINVESAELDAFSEADERLLTTIAGLIAAAIERLRGETEMEQRVHQRTAQLETANRELESFSYSVSHDLRAPLRGIDGYSRLLLDDYAAQLPPEAQTYVENLRQGARRMNQLIDDLLTFSRLNRQPLRKETIWPALLVQQVLEELKPQYNGLKIHILQNDLPACRADPALLRQVLTNLLDNAIKYSSKRDPVRIEINCLTLDGETVYYIRDNGIGFDMRYATQIFGVFQRLHLADEYEGTGVGLATVQRIIQRHGGRVWAESEIDMGTTFYFTLPPGD